MPRLLVFLELISTDIWPGQPFLVSVTDVRHVLTLVMHHLLAVEAPKVLPQAERVDLDPPKPVWYLS